MTIDVLVMGSATRWDTSHPIFLLFNTTIFSMGIAWKKSTPEGLRPPQYSEGGGAPGSGVQSVLHIDQFLMELIELFCLITNCRMCRRIVMEHWPNANEKRCNSSLFRRYTILQVAQGRTAHLSVTRYSLIGEGVLLLAPCRWLAGPALPSPRTSWR